MIRRLQGKFILAAASAILIVLFMVIGLINSIVSFNTYTGIYAMIDYIIDNSGEIPNYIKDKSSGSSYHNSITEESPFETRYFTILYSSKGLVEDIDIEHIAAVTKKEAKEYADEVIDVRAKRGMYKDGEHHYVYKVQSVKGNKSLIVFLDCNSEIRSLRQIESTSVIIGIFSFVLFMLFIILLSGRIMRPFAENYYKQKMFITNAGHELKTPLAIISANTEVIEMVNGKTEWTESIMNQVDRLSGLIGRLIILSRADEQEKLVMTEIDVSKLAENNVNSFKTLAEKDGKVLLADIAEDVKITGDEKTINELISILLDNAIKYCDDKGTIGLEVKYKLKKCQIVVSNDYENGDNIDYTKFFDRFYREDESHNSEKKGYGIGLSMAENIVKSHKGKISANYKNKVISFTCTI
ncbi:MAG: HAMP domain-containing histidine kinase [Lachnospiraceae bacterium]|nr:HAMP domain-containing histidine kinase [Lachnospiraceae bacterium]